MAKGGNIVFIVVVVVVLAIFLVVKTSSSSATPKYHINYEDHLTYYTDETGHEIRAFPDEVHNPDTCPICRARRAQMEQGTKSLDSN